MKGGASVLNQPSAPLLASTILKFDRDQNCTSPLPLNVAYTLLYQLLISSRSTREPKAGML